MKKFLKYASVFLIGSNAGSLYFAWILASDHRHAQTVRELLDIRKYNP